MAVVGRKSDFMIDENDIRLLPSALTEFITANGYHAEEVSIPAYQLKKSKLPQVKAIVTFFTSPSLDFRSTNLFCQQLFEALQNHKCLEWIPYTQKIIGGGHLILRTWRFRILTAVSVIDHGCYEVTATIAVRVGMDKKQLPERDPRWL